MTTIIGSYIGRNQSAVLLEAVANNQPIDGGEDHGEDAVASEKAEILESGRPRPRMARTMPRGSLKGSFSLSHPTLRIYGSSVRISFLL